jgi:hypothetical protein
MGFAVFACSTSGRVIRIVTGVLLMYFGWEAHSLRGTVVSLLGLVPLMAGFFDVCLIAPLFGLPLAGFAIRERASGNMPRYD